MSLANVPRLPTSILAASLLQALATGQGSQKFEPWFYTDEGRLVWDRHIYHEDQANTVFALSRELHVLAGSGQVGAYPEVLLFNQAQFTPPEGTPLAQGELRKIHRSSIHRIGLQLYVNYGDAKILQGQPQTYNKGTFFVSLDSEKSNTQTEVTVPDLGFSSQFISATRGAFGIHPGGGAGLPNRTIKPYPQIASEYGSNDAVNALYVTASVIYAPETFTDPAMAADASRDRYLVKDANGVWQDFSHLIPEAALEGNSSGVAFGDFDGDGYMDLYVGKCGNAYGGAKNRLLMWRQAQGQFVDETTQRILVAGVHAVIIDATNEVATADLDGDGDLDIVVANRAPLPEANAQAMADDDYVLMNTGSVFEYRALSAGGDSRSVAVGNINGQASASASVNPMEIVIANAGTGEFSNSPALDAKEPTKIYEYASGQWSEASLSAYMYTNLEALHTRPFTQQVMLVDLFANATLPASRRYIPDGYLDLVTTSWRAISTDIPIPGDASMSDFQPSIVSFFANRGAFDPASSPWLVNTTNAVTPWSRCVALSDFIHDPANEEDPFLDLFIGTGNPFSGTIASVRYNVGGKPGVAMPGTPWRDYGDAYTYGLLPGNKFEYGGDIADYNADGVMDSAQCARGYGFLVNGLGNGGHNYPHHDFTNAFSPDAFSSKRGRLVPRGTEDACFVDLDVDGRLDCMVATINGPSPEMPFALDNLSPDIAVLENSGLQGDPEPYTHSATRQQLPSGYYIESDDRVDLNGRLSLLPFPVMDRVIAGDLDNDGRPEIIAQFQGHFLPNQSIVRRLDSPDFAAPQYQVSPLWKHPAGWRYLRNVSASGGSKWLVDDTGTRMKGPSGSFEPWFNRGLGALELLDADGNGYLDLVSTFGIAAKVGTDVEDLLQTQDLLFLNKTGADAAGVLRMATTSGNTSILPQVADVIDANPTSNADDFDSPGSFFVDAGDFNADWKPDLVITRCQNVASNYPSLLRNTSGASGVSFVDEFVLKANPAAFDQVTIHSKDYPLGSANPTHPNVDNAQCAVFVDFDKDGDQDLVLGVTNNVPRFLRNKGVDVNGDGKITSSDAGQLGTFEDVTAAMVSTIKPILDVQDMYTADVDADGDLDVVLNSFNDTATVWRNAIVADSRPAVTEVWPRIGAVRGSWLELQGVNFVNVSRVELVYAGQTVVVTERQTLSPTRLKVRIPPTAPHGYVQIRVQRNLANAPKFTPSWSTAHCGYQVLATP